MVLPTFTPLIAPDQQDDMLYLSGTAGNEVPREDPNLDGGNAMEVQEDKTAYTNDPQDSVASDRDTNHWMDSIDVDVPSTVIDDVTGTDTGGQLEGLSEDGSGPFNDHLRSIGDTRASGPEDSTEILDPSKDDSLSDPDGDGLDNYQEYLWGTNPHLWDTDNDGLPDGFEVNPSFSTQETLDPLDPADATRDPDGDGLTNLCEYYWHWQEFPAGVTSATLGNCPIRAYELTYGRATDPFHVDTDRDGINDNVDIETASSPIVPDVDEPEYEEADPEDENRVVAYITPTTSDVPRFWRRTAYDRYLGDKWKWGAVSGALYTPGNRVELEVTVTSDAQEIEYDVWLNTSEMQASLLTALHTVVISDLGPTPPGSMSMTNTSENTFSTRNYEAQTYKFVAIDYQFSDAELNRATVPTEEELPHYYQLPANYRTDYPEVVELVEETITGATSSWDKVQKLKAYLEDNYKIGDNFSGVKSQDFVDTFLLRNEAKEGMDDEFARVMIIMCRLAGVPSRLAVGYTEGEKEGNGTYAVHEQDIMQWTEVLFNDYGWIELGRFDAESNGSGGGGGDFIVFHLDPVEKPDGSMSDPIAEHRERYWRAKVYDNYERKQWTASKLDEIEYNGDVINPVDVEVGGGNEIFLQIRINGSDAYRTMDGYMPAPEHTTTMSDITIPPGEDYPEIITYYDQKYATFFMDKMPFTYNISSLEYDFTEAELAASEAEDPTTLYNRYLIDYAQINISEFSDELYNTAISLTITETTDYQKAKKLEEFLTRNPIRMKEDMTGYEYLNPLLRDFLDPGTAMTLMARMIDLPARYVWGFYGGEVNMTDETILDVWARNMDQWAEIYFVDYGWIPFNPNPPIAPSLLFWVNSTDGQTPLTLEQLNRWRTTTYDSFNGLLFNKNVVDAAKYTIGQTKDPEARYANLDQFTRTDLSVNVTLNGTGLFNTLTQRGRMPTVPSTYYTRSYSDTMVEQGDPEGYAFEFDKRTWTYDLAWEGDGPMPPGLGFQSVQSHYELNPEALRRAGVNSNPGTLLPSDTTKVSSQYYSVQNITDLSDIRDRAEEVVSGGRNDYDKAIALEEYLTNQEVVNSSDGRRVIFTDELLSRFYNPATAFVVMARSMGIPSRYAEGYITDEISEDMTVINVTSGHERSWGEIFFPNYGWFPFDPMPAPKNSDDQIIFVVKPGTDNSDQRLWRVRSYDEYRPSGWASSQVSNTTGYSTEDLAYTGQMYRDIDAGHTPPYHVADTFEVVFNDTQAVHRGGMRATSGGLVFEENQAGYFPALLHTTAMNNLTPDTDLWADYFFHFNIRGEEGVISYEVESDFFGYVGTVGTTVVSPREGELAGATSDITSPMWSDWNSTYFSNDTISLAYNITAGEPDDHAKVNAILTYIASRYYSDNEFQVFRQRADPATAFIMLLRMNNISARYVQGYVSNEVTNGARIFRASTATSWAEVLYEDIGWVEYVVAPELPETRITAPTFIQDLNNTGTFWWNGSVDLLINDSGVMSWVPAPAGVPVILTLHEASGTSSARVNGTEIISIETNNDGSFTSSWRPPGTVRGGDVALKAAVEVNPFTDINETGFSYVSYYRETITDLTYKPIIDNNNIVKLDVKLLADNGDGKATASDLPMPAREVELLFDGVLKTTGITDPNGTFHYEFQVVSEEWLHNISLRFVAGETYNATSSAVYPLKVRHPLVVTIEAVTDEVYVNHDFTVTGQVMELVSGSIFSDGNTTQLTGFVKLEPIDVPVPVELFRNTTVFSYPMDDDMTNATGAFNLSGRVDTLTKGGIHEMVAVASGSDRYIEGWTIDPGIFEVYRNVTLMVAPFMDDENMVVTSYDNGSSIALGDASFIFAENGDRQFNFVNGSFMTEELLMGQKDIVVFLNDTSDTTPRDHPTYGREIATITSNDFGQIAGEIPLSAPGGRIYELIFVFDPYENDPYNRSFFMGDIFNSSTFSLFNHFKVVVTHGVLMEVETPEMAIVGSSFWINGTLLDDDGNEIYLEPSIREPIYLSLTVQVFFDINTGVRHYVRPDHIELGLPEEKAGHVLVSGGNFSWECSIPDWGQAAPGRIIVNYQGFTVYPPDDEAGFRHPDKFYGSSFTQRVYTQKRYTHLELYNDTFYRKNIIGVGDDGVKTYGSAEVTIRGRITDDNSTRETILAYPDYIGRREDRSNIYLNETVHIEWLEPEMNLTKDAKFEIDHEGYFNLTFTLPEEQGVGEIPFRATFEGSDFYLGNTTSDTMLIRAYSDTLLDPKTAFRGGIAWMNGSVVSDNGTRIPNAPMEVSWEGLRDPNQDQDPIFSDIDGMYAFPKRVSLDETLGIRTGGAAYMGQFLFDPSNTTASFYVITNTTLVFYPPEKALKGNITLEGKLVDDIFMRPLPNATIRLGWDFLGTPQDETLTRLPFILTTDMDGRFTLTNISHDILLGTSRIKGEFLGVNHSVYRGERPVYVYSDDNGTGYRFYSRIEDDPLYANETGLFINGSRLQFWKEEVEQYLFEEEGVDPDHVFFDRITQSPIVKGAPREDTDVLNTYIYIINQTEEVLVLEREIILSTEEVVVGLERVERTGHFVHIGSKLYEVDLIGTVPRYIPYRLTTNSTDFNIWAKTNVDASINSSMIRRESYKISGFLKEDFSIGSEVETSSLGDGLIGQKVNLWYDQDGDGREDRNEIKTTITRLQGDFEFHLKIHNTTEVGRYPVVVWYDGNEDRYFLNTSIQDDTVILSRTTIVITFPREILVGDYFEGTLLPTDEEGTILDIRPRLTSTDLSATKLANLTKDPFGSTWTLNFSTEDLAPRPHNMRVQLTWGLGSYYLDYAINITVFIVEPVVVNWIPVYAGLAAIGGAGGVFLFIWARQRNEIPRMQRIIKRGKRKLLAGNEHVATIFATYLALDKHFRKAKLYRDDGQTFREFEEVVREQLPINSEAMDDFLTLIEEARYSDHDIGAREKDEVLGIMQVLEFELNTYINSAEFQDRIKMMYAPVMPGSDEDVDEDEKKGLKGFRIPTRKKKMDDDEVYIPPEAQMEDQTETEIIVGDKDKKAERAQQESEKAAREAARQEELDRVKFEFEEKMREERRQEMKERMSKEGMKVKHAIVKDTGLPSPDPTPVSDVNDAPRKKTLKSPEPDAPKKKVVKKKTTGTSGPPQQTGATFDPVEQTPPTDGPPGPQPGMELDLPYVTPEVIAETLTSVVEYVNGTVGQDLDWTIPNLHVLDTMIDDHVDTMDIMTITPDTPLQDRVDILNQLYLGLAIYVGDVIVKNVDGARWNIDDTGEVVQQILEGKEYVGPEMTMPDGSSVYPLRIVNKKCVLGMPIIDQVEGFALPFLQP